MLVGVPVTVVLPWRFVDPPTSAVMLAWRWQHRDDADAVLRHNWVDAAHIARALPLALVAAEDQRFFLHHGFDLKELAEAVRDWRRGDDLRGASTISQQVVKNLWLWEGRSMVRKLAEAWLTLWLELLWPKSRILEVYMNIAQMGPGVYGIGAAAPLYFDRSPARLNRGQAALVAAVLPNPERMRLRRPSAYVRRRAAQIETEMARLGDGWIVDVR